MRRVGATGLLLVILLIPNYAAAQTSQIILLDSSGQFKKGEQIFLFGQIAQVQPDLFVVVQIVNPNGDLCHIQQLTPLSNGNFITDATQLTGRICGLAGDYTVRVFYGEASTTSSFEVLNERVKDDLDVDYLNRATFLVETKILSLEDKLSENQLTEYQNKLNQIKSMSAIESAISQLRALYSTLLLSYYEESDIFEVDPRFRPSIETALATTNGLVVSGTLDPVEANRIKAQTYDAMFYAQIGNHNNAISILSDVYVQITNVDPQKVSTPQPLTYEQLNDLLMNLMTKSNSIMSRQLKEELGFIFARGTGPIYSEELGNLVDMLTKSRTLDATLKRQDQLTLLIKTEWSTLRESLLAKESLEEFLEQKDKVDKLYEATLLLRHLDRVDRFTSADPKPELAVLIEPKLNELVSELQSATSPDDIISVSQDISDMRNVIDIASRISSTIEFSKRNNADQQLITAFESLLEKVQAANTLSEILVVVSEFDATINDLREKRSPLSILKFEYEKLKTKAELQADYQSLVEINNALKAIDTAMEIEKGNPTVSKIEKIEVLLSWASQNRPILQTKLDSYTKDAHKIRASDILQRAKSLENLLELGNTHNRFLPGYTDFTQSMKTKVDVARNLVIKGDLDGADNMVRELFVEWQAVSKKYSEDPYGSETGYTGDEIKRIEYRKKIENLSNFVTAFYNADFETHSGEFSKLKESAYELVDYGNFVDAEDKIKEIREFLAEKMELKNKKIIFDISYDAEKQIWVMSGAVDKQLMDRRQNLYLTVYDMQGNTHSILEFSDTKQGDLYTQWYAPTESGLYVVVLQWQNNQASQIVDVPEKTTVKHSSDDLKNVDYAREFEELKSFIETFGSTNYVANKGRFDPVINEIRASLQSKDFSTSSSKLKELQGLIERYLPSRSTTAVIDAYVEGDKLYVSGAIYKTIAFSEDIYVDIFDQKGNHVEEIRLKDNASGYFNQVLSRPFAPGTYVAQLQYHDLTVSDFFRVN
jgi:hypothetical protein